MSDNIKPNKYSVLPDRDSTVGASDEYPDSLPPAGTKTKILLEELQIALRKNLKAAKREILKSLREIKDSIEIIAREMARIKRVGDE